jgi:putative ABC transport system permease protein
LHEDEAEHTGVEYKIVGRMLPQGTPWDRAILVPVESVWDVHGLAMGHVHRHTQVGPPWSDEIPGVPAVVVKPKTIADAYRIRNLYNTDRTIAIFPADVLLKLYDILGDIRDVVAGISLATQIMVLIAILLTIFITINNRRKQIAVLRAMGATPAYIFCSIWLYTVFLIVTGAGLGLILGWLAAHILSLTFYARTGLELLVVITWQEVVLIASLVFFGMLVTIVPAWLSYRMPVAETLKGHE